MSDPELVRLLMTTWQRLSAFRHGEHDGLVEDLMATMVMAMERLEDEEL